MDEVTHLRLRRWLPWAILAVGAGALWLHASRYLPFIADDALISLRYAERFVEGKGLTWTDGERVEGYSNLLWVLATAALRFVGVELILASRVLGFLGMAAAIAALVWAHRPRVHGASSMLAPVLPGLVGALALAASGPVAVWAIGGLEQPFVAALLAWAVALSLPLVERGTSAHEKRGPVAGASMTTRAADASVIDAAMAPGAADASVIDAAIAPGAADASAIDAAMAPGAADASAIDAAMAPGAADASAIDAVADPRSRGAAILAPAIPLALLCVTRPDGALFTATIALAIVFARGPSLGSLGLALRLSALPAAVFLAQVAFRLAYYGDFVANTARVKVAFTYTRLLGGASYVGAGFWWLSGLSVLALFACFALGDASRRRRIALVATPLVVWAAYVSVIGGDIFPARRHTVPMVVLLAFLAAEALSWAAARGRRIHAAGWAVGVASLALLCVVQLRDPENDRAKKERWEWGGEVIGRALDRGFRTAQPLLAVDPAGCLPYFSKLPSLDMLGLNDRWLAMHPPKDVGHGAFAHEFGDGGYVYSRKPDLVLFCNPWGSERACFRGGRELLSLPGFRADYQLVTFEGTQPFVVRSKIYVRKESGKIGIRRGADAIEVPGFLLAATEGSVAAYLDDEARFAARLSPKATGKLRLDVPAGAWRIDLDGSGTSTASVELRRGRELLASGAAPLTLAAPGGFLELTIVPSDEAVVRSVRFERAQPLAEEAQPSR